MGDARRGSAIGIRIDPGAGAGYNEHLEYAGDRPTKFGIGLERLDDAIAAAARHQLRVDTVHFHAGSGWLADGLGAFERALAPAVTAVERLRAAGHAITEVNVGGGLGAPARQDEHAVDLDAYAAVLARHLGPLGVTIACEPGDQLTKDGAILLGEVVTVERRRGVTFVGLDIGWNVNCSYFIYRFAQELVVCRAAGAERTEIVTIAGHINEAGDVFAEDYPMPPVEEGDMVALLNAGGYLQAMSSTHCLRPMGKARLPRPLDLGSIRARPQVVTRSNVTRMSGRSSSRWSRTAVLGAKGRHRRGVFLPPRLEERRSPFGPQPRESRPVLVPAIDEDRHPRIGRDVADAASAKGRPSRFGLSSIGV